MKLQLTTKSALCGVFALACAGTASANLVSNGGFETGPAPGGFTTLYNGNTLITGWTVGGDSIDYIGSYWQPSEGGRSLDMGGLGNGSVSQSLSISGAGTVTVNFDLAGNTDGDPKIKQLRVTLGSLYKDFTFDTTLFSHGNMGWANEVAVFSVPGAGSYALTFAATDGPLPGWPAGSPWGPALDNVSASFTASAVPDGGMTASLLGMSLLGLVALRRKLA